MAFKVKSEKAKVKEQPILTAKDTAKRKLINKFSYNIEPSDRNPSPAMQDFKANHYKITIKNRETGAKATFNYSEGLGITHNSETRDNEIFLGLVSSLTSDLPYSDYGSFEGLGYEGEMQKKVYNAIVKQNEKSEKIGLKDFYEGLSEDEQEVFQ